MYRRALLATTAAVAAAATVGRVADADPIDGEAGDAGSGGDDAHDATGAQPNPAVVTDSDPVHVAVSEADPSETGAVGQASIEFASEAVHVEGTVLGETGCHGVELATTPTTEDGTFRIVVAPVDDAGPDELCTQALTGIGYEVDATFADGVPAAVAVTHADADGRRTVTRASIADGE